MSCSSLVWRPVHQHASAEPVSSNPKTECCGSSSPTHCCAHAPPPHRSVEAFPLARSATGNIIRGGEPKVIAGNGQLGYSGDGGQATGARLGFPGAIAVSATHLYVAHENEGFNVR